MSQEIHYLETGSQNPFYNLAFEETVLRNRREGEYLLLWQNDNTIVIGQNQNAEGEINRAFVEAHDIHVVRRTTGGGAVYHDLGNINFTFIARNTAGSNFDFATFCRPVIKALESFGVPAQLNGRNDMTIDGKKFSGNSQYMKHGRVMHHGTIMYDSDLEVVTQALNVPKDKIESKGLKSVRSRVTNVKPYVQGDISTREFWERLREFMFQEYQLQPYTLTAEDLAQVERLKEQVYDQWSLELRRLPRLPDMQAAPGGGVRQGGDPHGREGRGDPGPGLLRGLLRQRGQRRTGPAPGGRHPGGAGRARPPGGCGYRQLLQQHGSGHLLFYFA